MGERVRHNVGVDQTGKRHRSGVFFQHFGIWIAGEFQRFSLDIFHPHGKVRAFHGAFGIVAFALRTVRFNIHVAHYGGVDSPGGNGGHYDQPYGGTREDQGAVFAPRERHNNNGGNDRYPDQRVLSVHEGVHFGVTTTGNPGDFVVLGGEGKAVEEVRHGLHQKEQGDQQRQVHAGDVSHPVPVTRHPHCPVEVVSAQGGQKSDHDSGEAEGQNEVNEGQLEYIESGVTAELRVTPPKVATFAEQQPLLPARLS